MISISNQSTLPANVLPHGERFRNRRAAQTVLRRTPWIDFHKHASSFFRFVREHEKKVGPSSVPDRLCEHTARHSLNVQVFDRNQPVRVHNLARLLVMEIPALVPNVIVEALEQKHGFMSPLRAGLPTRNTTLQSAKLALGFAKPAGVIYDRSVAESCERPQSHIYTDDVCAERKRIRVTVSRKQRVPATRLPFDGQSLNCPVKWAVQVDSHTADLGQAKLPTIKCDSDLPKRQAVIAPQGSEPRIASALPIPDPAKESLKSQVNTMQDVFKCARIDQCYIAPLFSNLAQLPILIEPGNPFSIHRPSVAAFLDSRIVEFATHCQLAIQNLLLPRTWIDPITEGLNHAIILPHVFSFAQDNKVTK